jgi:hypothetical protein
MCVTSAGRASVTKNTTKIALPPSSVACAHDGDVDRDDLDAAMCDVMKGNR